MRVITGYQGEEISTSSGRAAELQARPSLPKILPSCNGKKAITQGMDSWIHGLSVRPPHQTPGDMFLEGFYVNSGNGFG